jgi:hypothetical protein
MQPAEAAGVGFRTRVLAQAPLGALLGPRVAPGPPPQPVAPEHYPRVDFYVAAAPQRAPGYARVVLRAEVRVWREGEGGGAGVLEDVDGALLETFGEARYDYEGFRLYCLDGGAATLAAGSTDVLARARTFTIHVSPALGAAQP